MAADGLGMQGAKASAMELTSLVWKIAASAPKELMMHFRQWIWQVILSIGQGIVNEDESI